MPAGARRRGGRQRGWPARQRNSSLLVSARQLQAHVRRLLTEVLPHESPPPRGGEYQSGVALATGDRRELQNHAQDHAEPGSRLSGGRDICERHGGWTVLVRAEIGRASCRERV